MYVGHVAGETCKWESRRMREMYERGRGAPGTRVGACTAGGRGEVGACFERLGRCKEFRCLEMF
jgi:hypothetical protein